MKRPFEPLPITKDHARKVKLAADVIAEKNNRIKFLEQTLQEVRGQLKEIKGKVLKTKQEVIELIDEKNFYKDSIASQSPWRDTWDDCLWCYADMPNHKPDCVYLKATTPRKVKGTK